MSAPRGRFGGLSMIVRRSLRQHALSTLVTVVSLALVSGLVILGLTSLSRSSTWRDSYSLWGRTLEHPMASPIAYDQLGLAHLTLGKNPEASVKAFEAGLEDVHRRGPGGSRLARAWRYSGSIERARE